MCLWSVCARSMCTLLRQRRRRRQHHHRRTGGNFMISLFVRMRVCDRYSRILCFIPNDAHTIQQYVHRRMACVLNQHRERAKFLSCLLAGRSAVRSVCALKSIVCAPRTLRRCRCHSQVRLRCATGTYAQTTAEKVSAANTRPATSTSMNEACDLRAVFLDLHE